MIKNNFKYHSESQITKATKKEIHCGDCKYISLCGKRKESKICQHFKQKERIDT
jgi:hypothetical protein